MSALSRRVVEEFCKLCDWSFQVWLNHRELFDDNPRAVKLQQSMGAEALSRLRTISHEYTLHQIAKLHDPAVVSGEVTLGVEYILKYDGWDQPTLAKLTDLASKLNQFARGLRAVRNKALSHNDLTAILSGTVLGEFEKDEDVKYFEALQEFVDLVHAEVIGGPAPLDDLVRNDVAALMAIIRP